MAFMHTSPIVTLTAVDARTRDTLSFTFNPRPQPLTIYVRLVELTAMVAGAGVTGILALGSLTNTNPRLALYRSGATYNLDWQTVGTSVTGSSVAIGTTIELRAILAATGIATLGLSIAGAAETTASTTALIIPVAWNTATVLFNAFSATSQGFAGYRNVEIVSGVRTMQQMRVIAGTD